jgi:hypothetical protein
MPLVGMDARINTGFLQLLGTSLILSWMALIFHGQIDEKRIS